MDTCDACQKPAPKQHCYDDCQVVCCSCYGCDCINDSLEWEAEKQMDAQRDERK